MQLVDVHDALMRLNDDSFVFAEAFKEATSYRGYYDEVAFVPADDVSLYDVKKAIRSAYNDIHIGWKGGEFSYNNNTPAHLAYCGMCGDNDDVRLEALVGRMFAEYQAAHQINSVREVKEKKVARENKAQRQERLERERAEQERQEREEYPHLLMHVLEDACSENFEITVVDGMFVVIDRDDRGDRDDTYRVSYGYLNEQKWALEDLRLAINYKREQRAEEQRRYLVKQSALAKLTKEERELLGV